MCFQKEPTVLELTVRSLGTHLLFQTRLPPLPLVNAIPDAFCHMKGQSADQQRWQAGPLHPHHSDMGPSPSQTLTYPNQRNQWPLGISGGCTSPLWSTYPRCCLLKPDSSEGKGWSLPLKGFFFPLCEFPPESINMTTHLHDILVFSLHACVKFVWFSKDVLYICKEARFVRVTQKVDKISVFSTLVENGLFLSLKKKAPIHYFLTTTVPLCETVHFHSETPCWRIVLQTDVCAEDVAWCGSPWLRPAAACLWWAHSVL